MDIFESYWIEITRIEAEETLVSMTIADYPLLKGSKRQEVYNSVKKHLHRNSNSAIQSTEEIARVIGGLNG